MRTPFRPLRALLALPLIAVAPRSARADDVPPHDVPATRPARSPHEMAVDALRDELVELELRTKVERSRRKLYYEIKERTAPPAPRGLGSAKLRRGSIVLPEILGVDVSPVGPGIGPTGISGPITFGSRSGEDGTSVTYLALMPSMDVFVSDHVTVGGRATAIRTATTALALDNSGRLATTKGYGFGLAPRVGYVVRLTGDLLFWPQGGVSVARDADDATGLGTTSVGASVEAALVVPLGRHVLAQVAPTAGYVRTWVDSGLGADLDQITAGVRGRLGVAF